MKSRKRGSFVYHSDMISFLVDFFVNMSFARSFRSNNDVQKKARQSLAMHLADAVLPWLSEVFQIFVLGLLRVQRFCLSKKICAKTFDPYLCATADESEPPQYCVLLRYYFIVRFHFAARRSRRWLAFVPAHPCDGIFSTMNGDITTNIAINSWLAWHDVSWALITPHVLLTYL